MDNLTLIIPAKNGWVFTNCFRNLELNCKSLVSLKNDDISTINSIKNQNAKFISIRIGLGNSLTEAIENCETELFCIFNADGSFDKMTCLRWENYVLKMSLYLLQDILKMLVVMMIRS